MEMINSGYCQQKTFENELRKFIETEANYWLTKSMDVCTLDSAV